MGRKVKIQGEIEEHGQRKYTKINKQTRYQLISMVLEEKKSIAQASRSLKLNPSTAKMILKVFKERGTVFEKKDQKFKREIVEKERIRLQKENEAQKIQINFTIDPRYYLNQLSGFPILFYPC